MKTSVFLFAFCLFSFSAAAVGDTLALPLVEKSPVVVDGKFATGEWDAASRFGGMTQIKKERMVPRDADVLLLATEESLFVATTSQTEGSETDGGFVHLTSKDGDTKICADDCYEIFVASADGSVVYQLLVNCTGTKCAIRYEKGKSAKFDGGMTCACGIRNDAWFLEAALPWSTLKGVDPKDFRFNLARNFVRAGFGYASLTGQKTATDAKQMISARALKGFGGVRVKGIDTSLSGGRLRITCDCKEKTEFNARVFYKDKTICANDPAKEQTLPPTDKYYLATAAVWAGKFGKVYHRNYISFEIGGSLTGGPVTDRRNVAGLGTVFTRFYPYNSKAAVIVSGMPKGVKDAVAEVASPDGQRFAAPLLAQPDGSYKAMVKLPKEKVRKAGDWKGAIRLTEGGTAKAFDDAWGFTEKKFPWQHNEIGFSCKVLAPFTPIEIEDAKDGGTVLKTVLREHRLNRDGLLLGVKSKGDEIFAAPLAFTAVVNGKRETVVPEKFEVYERHGWGARSRASGHIGSLTYRAEVAWDYDGFALADVAVGPTKAGTRLDSLTLEAPLKKDEATLFHALVDKIRGNPAGLIPAGEGKVWDSSTLIRPTNALGLPNFPGEFTPYLWFGGEEKGLALLFDSPKGFDLEDGKPMIRLVRGADRVTAQCDIVSRPHELNRTMNFQVGFQVTPVKPRMPGSEKWVPHYGLRYPGMLHFEAIASRSAFGTFSQGGFANLPLDKEHWRYAEAFRKAMRERRLDFDVLKHLATTGHAEIVSQVMANREKYEKVSYFGSVERTTWMKEIVGVYDRLTRNAMSMDRAVMYTCPSLINFDDEAYQYYKAEWSTLRPYLDGFSDRIFMSPDAVDYMLWTHRELLKHGVDGLNFDETWIIPQVNPDLSEVRDYKGRCIPETGVLAARKMFRRLAHLMDEMGHKERMIAPHLTNTMIIPEFAFCTIGIPWEYDISGNFIDQFPPDYIRAHSSGLQAGLVSIPLVIYKDPLRGKIPESEFCVRRNRSFRTALALTLQHGMQPMQRYWGDFSEQWWARYVLWAFGTHRADCTFLPYWTKNLPFAVNDGFIVGAYRRGSSTLFIVSNLGKAGEATVTFDPKALGIAADGAFYDPMKKEWAKAKDGRVTVSIPECEYRFLFAGPAEFGTTLEPPDPDWGYIIK